MAKKKEPSDPFGLLEQPYIHFGNAIEWARKRLHMSQSEFGAVLEGFSQTNIARYEGGETEPPLEFWRKFGRALGLNLTWAITGGGDPYLGGTIGVGERARLQHAIEAFYGDWRRKVRFNPFCHDGMVEHLGMQKFYKERRDRWTREEKEEAEAEAEFAAIYDDAEPKPTVSGSHPSGEAVLRRFVAKRSAKRSGKSKGTRKKK